MSTEKDHNILSALLDDEPLGPGADASLRRLIDDRELRDTVKRYRLIGTSLKGEQLGLLSMNLADSVSKALDSEPTVLAPRPRANKSRWMQPLIGSALAASVAAIGIAIGPQLFNSPVQVPDKIAPLAEVPTFAAMPVSAKETHWKTLEPEVESGLNDFLEDHSEQASWNGTSSIMPYTNYVSYDGR